MKRLATLIAVALMASPLLAEEPQTKHDSTAKNEPAKVSVKPLGTTSSAPAVEDSPLVAAAKRANAKRQKTPTKVITNATLAQTKGGHITTTKEQQPIVLPPVLEEPRPTPEMIAAQKAADQKKKAAEEAAAKAKKNEEEQRRRARAAARAEGAGEPVPEDAPVDDAERDVLPNKPPQR